MIKQFLQAKPWQIFLFIIIIPISILGIVIKLAMIDADSTIYSDAFFKIYWWIPLLILVVYGLRFAWIWSIGVGLNKHLPKGVWMNVKKFKWFLRITISYYTIVLCWLSYVFLEISNQPTEKFGEGSGPETIFLNCLVLIILIQMFANYATFFSFHFIANTVKSIQLGRVLSTNMYIGFLIGFIFPYIGVWFIQPVINKIEDGTLNPPTPNEDKTSRSMSSNTDFDLLD